MMFLFLIAAVVLLDLGLKDTIDEMDQEQFHNINLLNEDYRRYLQEILREYPE